MAVDQRFSSLLALTCLLSASVPAGEESEPPKPTSRTIRKIEGRTVRVDDRLLRPPHDALAGGETGRHHLRGARGSVADVQKILEPVLNKRWAC